MTKNISTLELTREQWLEKRSTTIGSSDIGPLCQLSTYKSPRDVYNEKAGLVPAFEGNKNTERGTRLEGVVAEEFEEQELPKMPGLSIRKDNKIRVKPGMAWATCNLDRLIVGDGSPVILELKTATRWAVKNWDAAVPTSYYAQVQWQMFVTGYRKAIIWVCVIDEWNFIRLDVDYSEDFAKVMEKAAADFMAALMLQDPSGLPLLPQDAEKMKPAEGTKVQATEEIMQRVSTLIELKNSISELKKTEKVVSDELKVFVAENEALVDGDRVLATYKTVSKKGYVVTPKSYREFEVQREKKEKK